LSFDKLGLNNDNLRISKQSRNTPINDIMGNYGNSIIQEESEHIDDQSSMKNERQDGRD